AASCGARVGVRPDRSRIEWCMSRRASYAGRPGGRRIGLSRSRSPKPAGDSTSGPQRVNQRQLSVRGEQPGQNGKEPMIGDRLERPAFEVVRGYDRTQVDAYVAEQASRDIEARSRMEELEAAVSEFEDLAQTSRRDRQRAHELLQHAQADRD